MQSEDVIQQLLRFVSENGRLPADSEPKDSELVRAAISSFGSLENALRMAGLLTDSSNIPSSRNHKKPRMTIQSELKTRDGKYPSGHFLNLLNLDRQRQYGPAPDGTPTWWERRANSDYLCSDCDQVIHKGQRYLGRKRLHPGQRGIYGHRGTYSTDYYHIVCMLKRARNEVSSNIEKCVAGISANRKEIDDFMIETSSRMEQIEDCGKIILQTEHEYREGRGVFHRIHKWLRMKYTAWTKTREIGHLRDRVSFIEKIEIPKRDGNISDLSQKEAELQSRLNVLDSRIQELSV